MKLCLPRFPIFLLVTACLLPTVAAQSQTLPVVDRTEGASPVTVSGTVTISEQVSGDQVTYSLAENIAATNISEKTILTMVVWLDVSFPRAPDVRIVKQYECFFAPDVINPGETHILNTPQPSSMFGNFDPDAPLKEAKAELRAVYIQFLDGSVFGDSAAAKDMLRIRKETEKTLWHLNKIYRKKGLESFAAELQEPDGTAEVDNLLENVRQVQREQGTAEAVRRVQGMLTTAVEREQAFVK
ncbi:MAG: hypothetical protein L0387_26555 [Acidobacteria bacterium]|nr:hypothetical protein [Acidobacteriota bacterium]